jgi:hypothetical protein
MRPTLATDFIGFAGEFLPNLSIFRGLFQAIDNQPLILPLDGVSFRPSCPLTALKRRSLRVGWASGIGRALAPKQVIFAGGVLDGEIKPCCERMH